MQQHQIQQGMNLCITYIIATLANLT